MVLSQFGQRFMRAALSGDASASRRRQQYLLLLALTPFQVMVGMAAPAAARLGLADIFLGESEQYIDNTISGSFQAGFGVPCQLRCAHLELGSAPYAGKRIISGDVQQVRGGFGPLGAVNQGLEPTGIHPFGPAFKVVLSKVNEAQGTAEFVSYFRYCNRTPVDFGCTPYFIRGPVLMHIKEGQWIPVG